MTNRANFPGWIRVLAVSALALGCALGQPGAWAQSGGERPRIVLVDRIVAVVGAEVITQYDLNERMARARVELAQRKTPLPEKDALQRQVIERLIIERVQLQLARDTGLSVDELQLDQAVARMAETNNMTLLQFRQAVINDGMTFDKFRAELRREIILSRLREREVENRISVSENEIDLYLEEQASSKEASGEYDLSHILVRVPEQASPEQIERLRGRAQEALKRARGGADFAQLSAGYSDAPEALAGGGLGWRPVERLPDLFVEAIAGMKPGEISEVLRSPAGFHLLRLNNRRGSGLPFLVEQNRVRHILARTNELVSESEAQRKLVNLRERIVNGVDFAELARLNSDDGSAPRGGDLGWIYPGDTVPEFERAMQGLKVGEVSRPVKSPFGWHLIQVQERRTADMSADRKRLEARKVLRDRKSGEAYQEWLRQLRDRAYVEYRLEER